MLLSVPRKPQTDIALHFGIRGASVYYYQKKFNIVIVPKKAFEPQKKMKMYADYLREYYARIGKPYQPSPRPPKNEWMPEQGAPRDLWKNV